jgi:hypothetical protein
MPDDGTGWILARVTLTILRPPENAQIVIPGRERSERARNP